MRPRRIDDETITVMAGTLFRDRGSAVPLSLIAKELGLTQAGLLNRVGSKNHLLITALCPGVPDVMAELTGPIARDPPRQLAALLAGLLEFLNEAIPALCAVRYSEVDMADVLPSGAPPPQALRGALQDWMARAALKQAKWRAEFAISALEARALNRHLGGAAFVPGSDAEFINDLVFGLME
jgi:AcrR family transcriptional regulator